MMRMIETLGEISKKLDTSTERLNKRLDNLEHRLGQRGILSGEAIEPPAIINEPSPTVDETLDPDSIPTGDHREDSKDDTESIEQQRFKRDPEPPPSYDHHVEHRHTHNRSDDTDIIRFPADHTTAAHQLMNSWPHIRQYCRDAGIFSDSYVMEVEEGRGLLRLYGWGEGDDKGDTGHQTASSPAHSAHSDETSVGASPPAEGLWGYGYPSPSSTESRRSSDLSSGDLTPEGTLKLDARIVNRLVNAYINNIHILHPFLDTAGLNKMIDGFVSRYGTGSSHVKSPGFAVPSSPAGASSEYHGGAPLKRKRSEGPIGGYMMSDSPKKPAPERSITSAICLLVLALGRACEVKQPLPGPSPEYISTSFGSSPGAVQTESPPATVRPSPASSHSTLASITSPNQEPPRFISRSRRSSVEGISKPERRDYSYGQRNMDVIPGLAYYAQAAAILGELHGGNDISHAHGFLLAGLYMGQFARVMESWSWINAACRVCNILVEKDKTELSKFDRNPRPQRSRGVSRRNLIKFAFWTALQLESDIRAELSNLPRSGIHDHEEDVTYPSQLYEDGAAYPKVETDQMLFHYSTQIHLRKAINKVHARLYDKRVSGMPLQVDEAFTLSDQLDNWRRLLNANVQWDDNDPPPGGINDARLRAKYYGGKYVATRAILRHAIYEMEEKPHLLQRFLEDPDALPVPESYTQGKPLTRDEQDLMIIRKCSECIQCAIRSTIAFDGCQSRIVVTNIFGTAHAQFGNMLVLTATWHSWLGALVDPDRLEKLNARTISFLSDLVPISPTMRKNILILKELEKYFHEGKAPPIIHSTHSSFNANMG
ncbi:hypothetical protein M501DRAFT_501280 [Patellaria atrata CBS 101060]|uniref:Transcription factor domain-containing protein n=1 Tax=Patellaria atrata CBS 101060 TaxID=1346257 RepID=A0A9P4S2B1_9PEZI|nr:hypothetical protein M501DRAFT_501280 [Patellaria atrata CBS 101060]